MTIGSSFSRVALLASVLWVCLVPATASPMVHEVELNDTAISPAQVTVVPGDTVRWLVVSGAHNLHSDTDSFKSWDSGPLATPGATFDLPMLYADGPGPFHYLCLWHGHRGILDVADTCWATGTLGEGLPFSVGDLVYMLRVFAGQIPPPEQLYRFDLTGDCVVNELDARALALYFQYGLDSLPPVYPVPTCCVPELQLPSCPVALTGDLDLSQALTSADVIRLITYVFKAGPAPLPCAAVADVNCSGTVTSSDVIALVNYIFKAGAPPCDVCELIPALWSCPD